MDIASLRSAPVRRLLHALNQGTIEEFMAVFAPDATVVDETTYRGLDEIRAWAERENFNVHLRMKVERENNPEGTVIEGHVRSNGGYNGPATFTFTLRGDTIERLVIQ